MRHLHIRTAILTILLFVLPTLCYPVRGGIGSAVTVFTYGFPFSWLNVHFSAHSGRIFLFQALCLQDQGVTVDLITAFLDLVILFVAIRAVLLVFGNQHRKHREQKAAKQQTEADEQEQEQEPPKQD